MDGFLGWKFQKSAILALIFSIFYPYSAYSHIPIRLFYMLILSISAYYPISPILYILVLL
jgi:hypothetical protein